MRYLLFISVVLGFWSCSEELDLPTDNFAENVNGFDVQWRGQVSEECKNTIRNILNGMVYIKGGFFVMGATPEQKEYARQNEYPTMYVQLDDYFMSAHEILPQEYWTIMGGRVKSGLSEDNLSISWNDWKFFIEVLNDITHLQFDFPTESQWEYAARGGEISKGYIYPGSNTLEDVRSESDTEGSTIPNELGLYNMADLRSEWCKDSYEDYTVNTYIENRFISHGNYMVVRGGNWNCSGETSKYTNASYSSNNSFGFFRRSGLICEPFDYRYCRISARSWHSSLTNSNYIGCRLVVNFEK